MVATLIILPRSESFSAVWPELAAEVGAELRVLTSVAELPAGGNPLAVVLSVAGVEEEGDPLLRELAAAGAPAPLVVGAREDHRLAVSLVRSGAADYFALPADLDMLRGELSARSDQREAHAAGDRLAEAERQTFDFRRIIGESSQLRAALDRAARIIPRDRATILITGETGTGKELLAQAIHYNGPRAAAPFVEINCTAIPGNLLESELFGYERGAFTDARAAKPGLFEAAAGGTVFLDEIGHLPLELQPKILRALEEKQIRRVGGLQSRSVDVRIIAVTHANLAGAVRSGDFREDLFYRLSVIPIHLPPLRERGEDVLLLAEHFLTTLAEQYDLPPLPLTTKLRQALLAHDWPGNVRELRTTLARTLLLGEDSIHPADLFPAEPRAAGSQASPLPFPAPLEEIERAAAHAMMERMSGNKSAAAEALGISRSRLYRLLDLEGVAE
ncbi:sigma-54 dependent transcriptional regulator [soil metagenome]